MLAWNVTAEVYAAIGEHDFSARVEANLPKPNDWVDRAAGDGSVVLLGQRLSDNPLGVPTTEFWNRSIQKVWSVDGTGPGPGDTLTPDLQDVDGTLWPDPETDYVLATNGVEVVGPEVARNDAANATLVRLDGPIRLRANRTGIAADGWTQGVTGDPTVPARAAYNRFDVSDGGLGTAVVRLSRETFCPAGVRLPGITTVRIGELGRGADKQPAIARETDSEAIYVPKCASRTIALPTPDGPWRVEVETRDVRAGRGRSVEQRAARARRARLVRRDPALAADRRDEVREARAEHQPRERAAALERTERADRRPRQPLRLRDEERPQRDAGEAGRPQLGDDLLDRVLPRIEVEDELALGEPRDAPEERRAVVGVVDRPEHGRGGDGPLGRERVQVALDELRPRAEATLRRLDHRRLGVDAEVAQAAPDQVLTEPAVAAGEVEDLVPRRERDPERRHELRPVGQVGGAVGVLGVRPPGRLAGVLVGLRVPLAHTRRRVSGCRRTKRAMLRACQSVCRERKRRSLTCAQSCRTRAAGTYHRSQPARIAR